MAIRSLMWTIRNVLLLLFMAVWATVVVTGVVRGDRPAAEDWAALGIGLAAIVALFKGNGSSPDQGGGSP